jgi:AbrB family looped-hinge helix DNA binding protein
MGLLQKNPLKTLASKGQISVPAEVRRRLALVPGSVLEWGAEQDNITVRRVGSHSFEAHVPLGTFDRCLAKLKGAQKL